LNRGIGPDSPAFAAASITALALLASSGCSGEPTTTATASGSGISDDEIVALKKSSRTNAEFRLKLRQKVLERQEDLKIVPADGKGKGRK
jgi:hypothetical protein